MAEVAGTHCKQIFSSELLVQSFEAITTLIIQFGASDVLFAMGFWPR
jgi:hypothetical protein